MMSIGDYLYILAIILFSYMTFLIIRGNFQRKFNDKGERLDLMDKKQEKSKNSEIKNHKN